MKQRIAYIYIVLTIVYLSMAFVYPVDSATIARRHLTMTQARTVSFGLAIPLIAMWFVSLRGASLLKNYSRLVNKQNNEPAFAKLASGIELIALYIPIRLVTRVVLNYVAHMHPGLQAINNILITYISLLWPLVAFILIGQAAHSFVKQIVIKSSLGVTYGLALVFIGLNVVYCYVSFTVKDTISAGNWLITPPNDIPLLLRILTIVIPYMFMWSIGFIAAYEIYLYQKLVKGVIYRELFKLLSVGLVMVILASIGLQFIIATASNLQNLPLGVVLLIAYSLILLLAVAFAKIGSGVQRLNKLDQV